MNKRFMTKSALTLAFVSAMAAQSALVKADEEVAAEPIAPEVTSQGDVIQVATELETVDNTADVLTTTSAVVTAAEDQTTQVETLAPTEGQTVDVRILATTDLHTNLVNYDYYQDKTSETIGLSKTALLIKEARLESPNTILVDNGDTIQGTPLGTYKALVDPVEEGEQHPMYAAMELLKFDASTLGNHEFNYGLDFLNRVIASANLPIVNANVLDATTKEPLYKTYEILTKTFTDTNGHQVSLNIGITGIVPPQILLWDRSNLEGKVEVIDSVDAVTAIIPEMRAAGADIILILAHSGIGDDVYVHGEENVGYQIAAIEGVDVLVTGHSHSEFPSGDGTGFYEKYPNVDGVNGTIHGTPTVMAGKFGDHLGVIDLGLTFTDGKWQVTSSHAEIRAIDTKSTDSHEGVAEVAKEAHDGTVDYVRQEVGQTTAPITSYFALVQDDPSIQIVNNAQLWYAKKELAGTPEGDLPILSVVAPFKAGTRGNAEYYTDIPAGPIAIKNVADLYVYDNITTIIKVTGADIKEWLEYAATQFNQIDPTSTEPQNIINSSFPTYLYDVFDGITYEIDITQPNKYNRGAEVVNADANRIINLQYQGQPIDPEQEFIVVTNNYRADGNVPGVKNATLKQELNLENRQAIINYIVEEVTINPSADNNWKFANTIAELDVRFETAERAKDLIANNENIEYIETATTEGFGVYRYIYTEAEEVTPDTSDIPVTPEDETGVKPNQNQVDKVTRNETRRPISDKEFDHIRRTVGKAYQETLAYRKDTSNETKSNQATLPDTGDATSFISLLGLALVSASSLFAFGKRKNN